MLGGYLTWWYNEGIIDAYRYLVARLVRVSDYFSLEILVKTWLAPWKNDVLAVRNAALGDQVKIWEQNLASRLVGFFVRTVVIGVSLIILGGLLALFILLLIGWVLTPFLIIILPILAILR